MKQILIGLITFCASFSAIATPSINASQQQILQGNSPTAAAQPMIIPSAPKLNAKGYVLMDANSGAILAHKNMHTQMQPASLTKLMTLYITFQALAQGQLHLDDNIRISENAWRRGGSRMFLKLGSSVPVKSLIEGVIVASGNDACTALAEYIAGSENSFAQMMNQTAQRLGMKHTHYVDSTGLPKPDHYATPYDLAVLTQHIINDFPQYYPFFKEKWITYNGIRQPNRNRLLWRDPAVDGLKTGHTKEAGYCLISSGKKGDTRLISVVMGTPSDKARANESQSLLNWGFRFYKTVTLYQPNQAIATPRVYFGKNKQIPVGVVRGVMVTIPAGHLEQLKANLQLNAPLKAPIQSGSVVGTLNITLDSKPYKSIPLVALQGDAKGGLWTSLIDHIVLLVKKIG